jgi:hypothetical protein
MPVSTIQNASLASGVPSAAKLPAGSVLQVVQATRNSALSYTTLYATYTSFVSGSITTTVANSKILVLCNVPVYQIGNGSNWSTSQYYQLLDGGLLAQQYEHAGPLAGTESAFQWQFQHLTASKAVGTYTFSMQGAITGGSGTVTIARNVGGNQSIVSLIMMEIAA